MINLALSLQLRVSHQQDAVLVLLYGQLRAERCCNFAPGRSAVAFHIGAHAGCRKIAR